MAKKQYFVTLGKYNNQHYGDEIVKWQCFTNGEAQAMFIKLKDDKTLFTSSDETIDFITLRIYEDDGKQKKIVNEYIHRLRNRYEVKRPGGRKDGMDYSIYM